MTEKNLNNNIVKKLYSNNLSSVNQALDEISQSGNSQYIPMLIDILHTHPHESVKSGVIKILSEIKHTNAVPELMKAIENPEYINLQETLIRICWENGLDFTNYFSTFIDLLIKGNYMIAFEAYTVIENSEGYLSSTSVHEYIDRLKEALTNVPEERTALIHSIIQFLPSLIKP